MADPRRSDDPDQVRMSFGEHLEELRGRLFKSVVALGVAFAAAVVWYQDLLLVLVQPHYDAMRLLGVPAERGHLIQGSYTQPIWAVMKLAFIVAVFVASPVVAYQAWRFIGAGLYPRERKYVLSYAPLSFLLFVGGCVFGYFILIPYGLYAMTQMFQMDIVDPTFTLSDYLGLVMTLTIVTGVIFELPLVMVFLTAIGLTTAKTWWSWIRFAIVAIFVAAAILTPSPDIFTQCLMAVPLMGLYFLGILMSAFVGGKSGGGPMGALVCLLFVVALGGGGAWGWWTYKKPPDPAVALLADLAGPKAAEAESRVLAGGPKSLPALRKALELAPADRKARVQGLIDRIDAAALLEASADRWFVVRKDGAPAGWMHLVSRPDGRLEDEVRVGTSIYRCTTVVTLPALEVASIEVETGTRDELKRWSAKVEGGKLVFADGRPPVPWEPGTATWELLLRLARKPTGPVLLADLRAAGRLESGLALHEKDRDGSSRRLELVRGDVFLAEFHVDDKGRLLKARFPADDLVAATEAEARAALK